MLRSTFIFIPGVGPTTERALWKQGFTDWTLLRENLKEAKLGTASIEDAKESLDTAERMLSEGNHQYFAKRLGIAEAWRAWPHFKDSMVYLDIETDGGMRGESVTMIGLYDGKDFKALIKDDSIEEFKDLITHYSMIVTFFGTGFDLPMLQKRFWGMQFDQIHLDLCPTLKRLGYRGGLKKIERQVGISRAEETDGLSGMDAIHLWNRHLRGDETALPTLIAYNREDVVNLEKLAELAYSKLEATVRGSLGVLC